MPSHWSFGHLQPKLWAKEGPGVKLVVWLPTTKSSESTSLQPPNWKCDTSLERSRRGLQVWFRPRRDQTSQSGVMSSQSLETPTWESREKEPFGCSLHGALQRILYGRRWWLPPSPGRGVFCDPKCPWLVLTPKGVLECELTTLWFVLDANSSLIY